MADTPIGETVTPEALGNNVTTTATPVVNAVDGTEVERLRKEKEQAEMRANQLANQLKAREDADAESQRKQLEEQNQYKDLYEQEKLKREAIEIDVQTKEVQKELTDTKQTILAEYSDEVKAIIADTGMDLLNTDEASVTAFKEKLDSLSKRVGTSRITANNPGIPNAAAELSGDSLRAALQDDNAFHDLVTKRFPVIKSMTKEG